MSENEGSFLTLSMLVCGARAARLLLEEDRRTASGLELAQWIALAGLDRAGVSMRMTDLAANVGCTRSEMTRLLRALITEGLVAQRVPGRDRRARQVQITAAGRRALRAATRVIEQRFEAILADLSPSLRKALDKSLHHLCLALAQRVRWRVAARGSSS